LFFFFFSNQFIERPKKQHLYWNTTSSNKLN